MKPKGVNPGYAAFQIAKALRTTERHDDLATRERAKEKVSRWETVLRNILTGAVKYGSRTPIEGIPSWATPEVVTGGFVTGRLLASGPLEEHEKKLLEEIPGVPQGEERRALNAHFLTDAGLADLRNRGLTVGPELCIGDGALGFWNPLNQLYPSSVHQRCWVHKTANVHNKLPKAMQPKVKEALHDIWMAETKEDATTAFNGAFALFEVKYPKAMAVRTLIF